METQPKSLALVQQEWKPYENGSALPIVQAQSAITIRHRSESDIKDVLRYAMVLVGLRGNNMPTDEEKFVLLNFIRTNFGNQTPEEIRLAFEYAISGKFETDVKCYENFSCEYFARIMKAYIEYSRQEVKSLPKQIEPMKDVPTDLELKKMAIENANFHRKMLIDYNKGNSLFNWKSLGGLASLYSDLKKFDIFKINEDEQKRIMEKFKHLKGEEFNVQCRSEAYKFFIQTLVDFDCYIDNDGTIKQIE
jgi:hypothetical protein